MASVFDFLEPQAPIVPSAAGGSIDLFVREYGPVAESVAERIGVSPRILLAQWGLETGFGKSIIPGTNNLGNIKGAGVAATDNATGSRDQYRAYEDPEAFADDFAGLIARRYPNAVGAGNDMLRYASALKKGGYAEDPLYVQKLVNVAKSIPEDMIQKDVQKTRRGHSVFDFLDSQDQEPAATPGGAMLERLRHGGKELAISNMGVSDILSDKFNTGSSFTERAAAAIGKVMAQTLPKGGGERKTGLSDTAVDLAQGTVGLGESIVGLGDLATFGMIGKALAAAGYDPKGTKEFLAGLYTKDRQEAEANVEAVKGFMDRLGALAVNPSALIGRIAQSLPGTIGAGAVARAALPAATEAAAAAGLTGAGAESFIAKRVMAAASGAEGAQSAGSIAEAGRQSGKEWTDYAAPAAAGGALTAGISYGSGRFGQKLGIGDVETDIGLAGTGANLARTQGGFARRVPSEMVKEGIFEEMPQSAQEQVFQNIATGRPIFEGVPESAAEGLVAGAGMGGGHAALFSHSPPRKSAMDEIATATTTDEAIAAANRAVDEVSVSAREYNADMFDPVALLGYSPHERMIAAPDGTVGGAVEMEGRRLAALQPQDVLPSEAVAANAALAKSAADSAVERADQLAAQESAAIPGPAVFEDQKALAQAAQLSSAVPLEIPDIPAAKTNTVDQALQILQTPEAQRVPADNLVLRNVRERIGGDSFGLLQQYVTGKALMTRDEMRTVQSLIANDGSPPVQQQPIRHVFDFLEPPVTQRALAGEEAMLSTRRQTAGTSETPRYEPRKKDDGKMGVFDTLRNTFLPLPMHDRQAAMDTAAAFNAEYSLQRKPGTNPVLNPVLPTTPIVESDDVKAIKIAVGKKFGDVPDVKLVQPSELSDMGRGETGRISRQEYGVINAVSDVFKKKVVLFDSEAIKADGIAPKNSGTIYLNARSSVSHMAVFGHEMLHQLKRDLPDAYQSLSRVVATNLDEEGKKRFAEYYGKDGNLEEMTADLVGNRFQEADFWKDVFGDIAAKYGPKSKGIILRLADAMYGAIRKVIAAVSRAGFETDTMVRDLEEIRAAVKEAVRSYAERQKNVSDAALRPNPEQSKLTNKQPPSGWGSIPGDKQKLSPERPGMERQSDKIGRGATTLNDIESQWSEAGIENSISERNGTIRLSKIIVPKDSRNAGKGTAAMQSLVDYADRTNQRIILTASSDFGGNKKRLVEFYKRFGFVDNKGRYKDYSIMESMYRPAKNQDQDQPQQDTITVDGVERQPPPDTAGIRYSTRRIPLGKLTPAQEAAVNRVFGTQKTWAERWEDFRKDWQKELVQGVFDQFAPLRELGPMQYILARMTKGGDATIEALLMYGKVYVDKEGFYRVDYNKMKGLNGFAKVLAALDGEHDRFLSWVSAIRAERLKGIGLENLMSAQDIATLKTLNQGTLQNGNSRVAAYNKALEGLNEFNDSVLKIAVDSGLIDEDTRKMYKDVPYIPFYRLSEEEVLQGPTVKSGLVNQYAWKKLKGGTDKLNEDLLANLLKNWSHLITASAKNRAAKSSLDAAVKVGAAKQVPNSAPGKGLVSYSDNGVDKTFLVKDPHLMDAISSLGFTNKVPAVMRAFKQVLTMGVTANPAFKIRNLIRDSIAAVGTSQVSYNVAGNLRQGWQATELESETRAQMLAAGGMIRFGSMLDGNNADRTRRLVEQGISRDHILDDNNKIAKFWKHRVQPAFDAYQELGDRGEQINRAALYEQLIAKGMSHGEAAFWARDLMDFSNQGKWAAVRYLTSVVPFMNARLQGLYKLGRAGAQDWKRMSSVMSGVIFASIGLMLAYRDDDDWKRRQDWDRENYWWVKIGDLAFVIPKPFEIGAIGSIAERGLEWMIDDEMTGDRFAKRMGAIVGSQLSMNPTPQLVKPLIDLWANKDSFTGQVIETSAMQRLKPEDRYTERTSEVARFLGSIGMPDPTQLVMGRWDELSPSEVDFLIRGYFAWVGTAAVTVLDYGIRPMLDRGERPAMKLEDVFLAGAFVKELPAGQSRYVTQLYDQAKEIEQAYASYHEAIKLGDLEKATKIKESDSEKIAQYASVARIKRHESELNQKMKLVLASKNMSADEKREALDKIAESKDQIARSLSVP